jgi:hypothetical protein
MIVSLNRRCLFTTYTWTDDAEPLCLSKAPWLRSDVCGVTRIIALRVPGFLAVAQIMSETELLATVPCYYALAKLSRERPPCRAAVGPEMTVRVATRMAGARPLADGRGSSRFLADRDPAGQQDANDDEARCDLPQYRPQSRMVCSRFYADFEG